MILDILHLWVFKILLQWSDVSVLPLGTFGKSEPSPPMRHNQTCYPKFNMVNNTMEIFMDINFKMFDNHFYQYTKGLFVMFAYQYTPKGNERQIFRLQSPLSRSS